MKKALFVAAALVALPSMGHAQEFAPLPGFYIGAGVGAAWYLTSTTTVGGSFTSTTGLLADIVAGYDFVGPRVELEVGFGFIPFTANLAGTAAASNFSGNAHQLHIMGKVLYDFFPASTITPYIGAGAGVAFVDGNTFLQNTLFAYEGILGAGLQHRQPVARCPRRPLRRHHQCQRRHQRRECRGEQLQHRGDGLRAVQVRSADGRGATARAAAGNTALLHGVLRLG